MEEESPSARSHKLLKEEDPQNKTAFYPDECLELILAKGLRGWTHPACVSACVSVCACSALGKSTKSGHSEYTVVSHPLKQAVPTSLPLLSAPHF